MRLIHVTPLALVAMDAPRENSPHASQPADDVELPEDEYEIEAADEDVQPLSQPELPVDINETWLEHHRQQEHEGRQFTLSELLFVTSLAAVVLGFASLLSVHSAAGVLGLLTLVVLGLSLMDTSKPHLIRLLWWVLLSLYLVLSLTAMFVD